MRKIDKTPDFGHPPKNKLLVKMTIARVTADAPSLDSGNRRPVNMRKGKDRDK